MSSSGAESGLGGAVEGLPVALDAKHGLVVGAVEALENGFAIAAGVAGFAEGGEEVELGEEAVLGADDFEVAALEWRMA